MAYLTRTNWVDGEVPAAADLNAIGLDIRTRGGDENYAGYNINGLGAITQDAWTLVTPLNGWSNAGGAYPTMRARMQKEQVIRVLVAISGGTITNDTVVGTLPVGLRPSYQTPLMPVVALNAAGAISTASLYVYTNGDIKIYGAVAGVTYVYASLSFPA